MTYCWESQIPPNRCHSSCAVRHPAGPALGLWWKRSLAGGDAKKAERKTNTFLQHEETIFSMC